MYYIIELQTNDGVASSLPPQTRTERKEALSVYHSIMAAAAISNVEYHTCIVIDEQGRYHANECFKHPRPPQGGEES
ncbi:MAG: hypothetical protein GX777_03100 [Fastidiosipila sp.]|nr:hypothetical protein [Fastidiosipila sp.]